MADLVEDAQARLAKPSRSTNTGLRVVRAARPRDLTDRRDGDGHVGLGNRLGWVVGEWIENIMFVGLQGLECLQSRRIVSDACSCLSQQAIQIGVLIVLEIRCFTQNLLGQARRRTVLVAGLPQAFGVVIGPPEDHRLAHLDQRCKVETATGLWRATTSSSRAASRTSPTSSTLHCTKAAWPLVRLS